MELIGILISSVVSLAVLFILTKLMGRKQVSQLSMFDYIIGISIGSIAAEAATELETPLNSLLAMVVYGVIAFAVSDISQRSLTFRKIITGKPIVILDNGRLYLDSLKKSRMDVSDFLMQCRAAGYFDLNQIQTAVVEYNGAISFLPTSTERPATPSDIKLVPAQEFYQAAVIMDGNIIAANLKISGNNEVWLKKELQEQGISSVKDVLLAMCDRNNKLTVYKKDTDVKPIDYAE